MKKSVMFLTAVCLAAALLGGCAAFGPRVKMPVNGDIVFHDIAAVVPSDYIRDSTQSSENVWIFEKGYYKKTAIFQRSDIREGVDADFDNYVDLMKERGAESERVTFRGNEAVMSTYYKDDICCRELLFACNGSYYAFALRGGTEEEFNSFLNDIAIRDVTGE